MNFKVSGSVTLAQMEYSPSSRRYSTDSLSSLNNLGPLLQDKAIVYEPLYRRDLKGSEATLGKNHPDTLVFVNNLDWLQL